MEGTKEHIITEIEIEIDRQGVNSGDEEIIVNKIETRLKEGERNETVSRD